LTSPLDYQTIVDVLGSDATAAEMLSEYQRWIIIGKCQLLLNALIIPSTMMPQCQSWDRICQEAIKVFGQCGAPQAKNLVHYAIGI
jgi:hypothetical protein